MHSLLKRMTMELFFYCQNCNEKIDSEQLGQLDAGKCPKCHSLEGFSTIEKDMDDGFETLRVINDTELLAKTINEE